MLAQVWQQDAQVGYKFERALRGHEAAVYGLTVSKDGNLLVSCSGKRASAGCQARPATGAWHAATLHVTAATC